MMLIVRPPSDESRMEELRAAAASITRPGHAVDMRLTEEAGDARRFARMACDEGYDIVVAAGGDGTINEVVNGMMSTASAAALGVVPLGTANDFAHGLGLSDDVGESLRIAAGDARKSVDVARVNGHCFINVSTGGFGAEATQAASREVKRHLGPFAYLIEGVRKLVAFDPGQALFRVDGEVVHDGSFIFFAVGNACLTGGGTPITPRADLDDGKLDVALIRGSSRLDFLSLLPDLRAGTHLESPDVSYFRCHDFHVESAVSVPVNADGEPVDGRSFHYDVLDRQLLVAAPS